MENALPRGAARAPRTWQLCMTSENHGTVGPAGCTFSHAPEKHERVLVVEVAAAANKAEVDLTTLDRWESGDGGMFRNNISGEYVEYREVKALVNAALDCIGKVDGHSTPPATTGASTARPDWLEYDAAKHILTIYGVKYSGDLFSGLGLGPVGMSFTILAREDGALTLCRGAIVAPAGHVAVPTDEVIVTALHACAIDTRPSKYGFPELQVDATNVPGIRAVYMKIAAAMQASTSGERQEGGAA
ncbi:hypothetical protein IFT74_15540 [Oxalobacteraceae sp. CFBP 8755]|nr:hypothetical protein [Oxalobacteraceae sp. CFBP 8755]